MCRHRTVHEGVVLARRPPPKPPKVPCPEGFHWIGQSFATCDHCGLPAWEHAGQAVPAPSDRPSGASPWRLAQWEQGEAERIRQKWEPTMRRKEHPSAQTAPAGAAPTTLDTHYGPTADDPEPGKVWHRGCGGEVWGFKEGRICSKCGGG